jgi:hypothetical protein
MFFIVQSSWSLLIRVLLAMPWKARPAAQPQHYAIARQVGFSNSRARSRKTLWSRVDGGMGGSDRPAKNVTAARRPAWAIMPFHRENKPPAAGGRVYQR